ncbi:MAG: S41 family peptidase [Candidatus Peregrinibacteria bacterium]|nr:S41 family peptidase [Candidatus Peregrinibacteria bacterium]
MRFKHSSTSGATLLLMVVLGGFIGWQSALYTVKDQLEDALEATDTTADNAETEALMGSLDLELFWEVYSMLEGDYVDDTLLDNEAQLYGAIKGLVDSFDDPYTVFMTPEESSDFQDSLEGTLQGIGAELTMQDGELTVIAPLKGSPAEEKGLKPGDVIYMIDEEFVSDLTLFEAIMSIRGEEGTTVKLTLIRDGETEPLILEIERAVIEVPSVELEYYGDDEQIAYISIYQFTDSTEIEFDEAVQDILLNDVEGMILDLRYNGGGFLEVSVDILSDFIEGKEVAVITKHRDEADNEIFYTNESARLADIPMVVLVNEGSASASEIVAGAIQDYERGLIMGIETFGKGSVQIVQTLEDRSSLRMTIAKWYTPNDRSIDDVGITPDTIVEISDEDYENDIDTQLDAAIEYLEEL